VVLEAVEASDGDGKISVGVVLSWWNLETRPWRSGAMKADPTELLGLGLDGGCADAGVESCVVRADGLGVRPSRAKIGIMMMWNSPDPGNPQCVGNLGKQRFGFSDSNIENARFQTGFVQKQQDNQPNCSENTDLPRRA
jgi:hypothetical protein